MPSLASPEGVAAKDLGTPGHLGRRRADRLPVNVGDESEIKLGWTTLVVELKDRPP